MGRRWKKYTAAMLAGVLVMSTAVVAHAQALSESGDVVLSSRTSSDSVTLSGGGMSAGSGVAMGDGGTLSDRVALNDGGTLAGNGGAAGDGGTLSDSDALNDGGTSAGSSDAAEDGGMPSDNDASSTGRTPAGNDTAAEDGGLAGNDTAAEDGDTPVEDDGAHKSVESELIQDGGGETGGQGVTSEIITDTEADDNVTITEDDKPYLALGANLNKEQKNTVLQLMGVDPLHLEKYHVVTVTNEEEHQYLDDYLDASTIGSRALSSVVIVKREKGAGIHISTKNISYCTIGMYKNALATAGLEDADVIVAGPFPLSGTAALIGAMKAYADMEDTKLDADSLDAAMNEIVVTGELVDSLGEDGQSEEFMAYVKQQVLEKGQKDIESIRHTIEEACKLFEISLNDSQKTQIASLMEKVSSLDLDVDSLVQQAGSIYESIAEMTKNSGIMAGIANFFKGILDAIVRFLEGLF